MNLLQVQRFFFDWSTVQLWGDLPRFTNQLYEVLKGIQQHFYAIHSCGIKAVFVIFRCNIISKQSALSVGLSVSFDLPRLIELKQWVIFFLILPDQLSLPDPT